MRKIVRVAPRTRDSGLAPSRQKVRRKSVTTWPIKLLLFVAISCIGCGSGTKHRMSGEHPSGRINMTYSKGSTTYSPYLSKTADGGYVIAATFFHGPPRLEGISIHFHSQSEDCLVLKLNSHGLRLAGRSLIY